MKSLSPASVQVFYSATSSLIEPLELDKSGSITRFGRSSLDAKKKMRPESLFYSPDRTSLVEKRWVKS